MKPTDGALESIVIEAHLETEDPDAVVRTIRNGLLEDPKRISSRFFYDDRGSALFERICELPEYYQTRTEHAILARHAAAIVEASGAREMVELGSGAATKTRVLLDAMERAGRLHRYVPFDVNEGIVRRTAAELVARHRGLAVHGVIGDFMNHLDHIPDGDRRLVIFLGGTIGNLTPSDAVRFLTALGRDMTAEDHLLLGTDRIKDRGRLLAAYNDSNGVTAAFNLNVLEAVNRIAGGDFRREQFEHEAIYNEDEHRIEMWLRSLEDQTVELAKADLILPLERGEGILTEISTKYDRGLVENLLEASGFEPAAWYTDTEDLFALSLARKKTGRR